VCRKSTWDEEAQEEWGRGRRTATTVAEIPDTIVLERDRDLVGRAWEIWVRRGLIALMPLVAGLALLNVFGQRPTTSLVGTDAVELKVYSPPRVRSGLVYGARFTITARRELENAILVLHPGWLEGITLNTVEPAPVGEASDNGFLSLELGRIPADQVYRLFMDFQVNPNNIGHRPQTVELYDGEQKLVEVDRSITIFP
jgi:hypothetical protein